VAEYVAILRRVLVDVFNREAVLQMVDRALDLAVVWSVELFLEVILRIVADAGQVLEQFERKLDELSIGTVSDLGWALSGRVAS